MDRHDHEICYAEETNCLLQHDEAVGSGLTKLTWHVTDSGFLALKWYLKLKRESNVRKMSKKYEAYITEAIY